MPLVRIVPISYEVRDALNTHMDLIACMLQKAVADALPGLENPENDVDIVLLSPPLWSSRNVHNVRIEIIASGFPDWVGREETVLTNVQNAWSIFIRASGGLTPLEKGLFKHCAGWMLPIQGAIWRAFDIS